MCQCTTKTFNFIGCFLHLLNESTNLIGNYSTYKRLSHLYSIIEKFDRLVTIPSGVHLRYRNSMPRLIMLF